MTLTEPSRRERKKEETKRRIFEAAIGLFRTKGFEATTVDEITEKADVARGTFFNYFPKKESVLAYLSEERMTVAQANATALLSSSAPVRDRLIDLYLQAASAWEENRDLSQFVFGEWLRRAFAPATHTESGWRTIIYSLLDQGRANGELRADVDNERADAMLTAIYMTTLFHWLFCPPECLRTDFELRGELKTRLAIVFDGLVPRPGEVKP